MLFEEEKANSRTLFEQIQSIVNIYYICAWLVVSETFVMAEKSAISARLRRRCVVRIGSRYLVCKMFSHRFTHLVLLFWGLFSISFIILCAHLLSRFYLVVCLWPFATVPKHKA